MATEAWTIDGVALTSGAFGMIELTADPPAERADWISAADSESAALFRQPKHYNRTITMKLRVTPQASMNAALDQVAALVDKLRKASSSQAGVGLTWAPASSSRSVTFTVLTGEIKGLPIALSGDGYSWLLQRPIVVVEMTCHPYWLGTETLVSTASSSTPFVAQEIAGVTGDVPALGRLIITDTATQSRRHVEWGLEGPLTYNAATSLLVDSDDMVTTGFVGTQTTATGAYDPNASGNSTVTATLAPGQIIAVCGIGNLSHVGGFRVKARVQSTSLNNQFRLVWQSGDGPMAANEWASVPLTGGWVEIDLGPISITAMTVGTQRWTGRVEVLSTTPSPGTVLIDYLVLAPTSDGYGVARAAYSYLPGVLVGYDQFTSTTAGSNLNARSAPLGGSWATSGVATDFTFADGPVGVEESVTRATSSEATPRFAVLGLAVTDTEAYLRVQTNSAIRAFIGGVLVRWVDSSNYIRFYISPGGAGVASLDKVVAGVTTSLGAITLPQGASQALNQWLGLRVVAYASGGVFALAYDADGNLIGTIQALVSDAGVSSGKGGVIDFNPDGSGATRWYDDFAISTPAAEPIVLYSGRNMQVRYDDTIRQDSTGVYTGRPRSYRGRRFLVPVGTSRVLVKARRKDVAYALDDAVTDATQIQIGWTPRGLAVPR